ncbi:translation initiation factor eIF-2B beta subunit [Thraustotheca clavata]|uniref:Translation initiation factor eIF2B subunit beta n=1 Tax=Thraustotheca clavata TaxID=74557 RepID=A0A1V9YTY4_9STRA|nr:translation initiation factor eIF-2B beta subunit [Thraustotheca clavata]
MDDDVLLQQWLAPWPKIVEQYKQLVVGLKRRQITGSYETSRKTTELLRAVLGAVRWAHARQLMENVRMLGRVLVKAMPQELAIGNVIRRVLFIIREEYLNGMKALSSQPQGQLTLGTILTPGTEADFTTPIKELKQTIMEGVSELMDEIENLHISIADQAMEYIHANEVILTFGLSTSVEEFLKAAAKKRQFKVIVVESTPLLNGQNMAHRLAESGIDTTVITDSAVYAMMARVNKVVIPAVAVVANGGLIAQSGIQNIALAAKKFCVPVVSVAGLFKLCPLYPHDVDVLNELVSPAHILNYDETLPNMDVLNPANDYVPPEFVTIFITNTGAYQPSYIYRLLTEYYSPQDYQLL